MQNAIADYINEVNMRAIIGFSLAMIAIGIWVIIFHFLDRKPSRKN